MPDLMRLGDGEFGILPYRPTVAKPPETRALAKLTLTESGFKHLALAKIKPHNLPRRSKHRYQCRLKQSSADDVKIYIFVL